MRAMRGGERFSWISAAAGVRLRRRAGPGKAGEAVAGAAGGLDEVGVAVGELEGRGALRRDVLERARRRADADEEPQHAAAQPQRLGVAPREAAREPVVEGG